MIMMRYIVITALSLFLFLGAEAQSKAGKSNIGGHWKGTITQDEGGYRTDYEFELYLTQSGNKITGRSYVYLDDIYAIIELKGTIKSGLIVMLEETVILDHRKTDDMEWCMKKAQLLLKYENNELLLDGYWQGTSVLGDCIPGKIHLKRSVPRA